MTKTILKYLLSLCILLLSVYGQVFAHAYQEFSGCTFATSLKAADYASLGMLHNTPDFTVKATATEKSLSAEAVDIEEEDEYYSISKKYIEYSKYLAAAFYALALAFFFCHIKTSLRFCKHFSFNSFQKRYLLFQVFRI